MKITKDWLNKHRTKNGGFTKNQLNSIGVQWPPIKDWILDVIGKEITEEQRQTFERHS